MPEPVSHKLLWPANAPWNFWRLLTEDIVEQDWREAAQRAMPCLAGLPIAIDGGPLLEIITDVLGEGQFGHNHWQLSHLKRLYYAGRAFLPAQLRPVLRRVFLARQGNKALLSWPVEGRFACFQWEMIRGLLTSRGLATIPYIHFWPQSKRFAFVLTHDVEGSIGHQFVREVAALEERYGFRSCFNFVPELYPVDQSLLTELRERGFEVGVHGLKHDGKLFSSKTAFMRRTRRINQYLKDWRAVGFRSPMTHRHPEWMQALEIEYDSSFFDTDPFEPIPGGTMSIWPFILGNFVELPYTLAQDHTLMVTLGERTPRLWLEKVDFIAQHCGLALLNSHPDYLFPSKHFTLYEDFLRQMRERSDYWHALPMAVARWWRRRAGASAVRNGSQWLLTDMLEGTIGRIELAASVGGGAAQAVSLVLIPG